MAKKFYASREFAKLSVVVADADREKGEVAPQTVDFVPYEEKWEGDKVYVGYLATDNEVAQKILANDQNVEEIDADEYKQRTGEKAIRATI